MTRPQRRALGPELHSGVARAATAKRARQRGLSSVEVPRRRYAAPVGHGTRTQTDAAAMATRSPPVWWLPSAPGAIPVGAVGAIIERPGRAGTAAVASTLPSAATTSS